MSTFYSVELAASGAGSGVKGVMGDYRRGQPAKYALPFHIVIPAVPGTAAILVLNMAPKGFKPTGIRFACEALSASAGVSLAIVIGIASNTNLFMVSTDCDVAVSLNGNMPVEAYDYEFATDDSVIATISAHTPIAGRKIWGEIEGNMIR